MMAPSLKTDPIDMVLNGMPARIGLEQEKLMIEA